MFWLHIHHLALKMNQETLKLKSNLCGARTSKNVKPLQISTFILRLLFQILPNIRYIVSFTFLIDPPKFGIGLGLATWNLRLTVFEELRFLHPLRNSGHADKVSYSNLWFDETLDEKFFFIKRNKHTVPSHGCWWGVVEDEVCQIKFIDKRDSLKTINKYQSQVHFNCHL